MAEQRIEHGPEVHARIMDLCKGNPARLREALAAVAAESGGYGEAAYDESAMTILGLGEFAHLAPAPEAISMLEAIRSPFMQEDAPAGVTDCARAVYIMRGGKAAAAAVERVVRANAALAKMAAACNSPHAAAQCARLAEAAAEAESALDKSARACYADVMGHRPPQDVAGIIEALINEAYKPLEKLPDAPAEPQKKTACALVLNGWRALRSWLRKPCRQSAPMTRSGESPLSPTTSYTSNGSACVAFDWRSPEAK